MIIRKISLIFVSLFISILVSGYHQESLASWICQTVTYENFSSAHQYVYDETFSSYKIATDGQGNFIFVWRAKVSDWNYHIFKSEYRDGQWLRPTAITDHISPDCPGGAGVQGVQVAMSPNGDAIITWAQKDAGYSQGEYQIYKSEYRYGEWTHPTDLADHISPEGDEYYHSTAPPRVAMDGYGNAIIVWISEHKLYKHEYRSGSWTTEHIKIKDSQYQYVGTTDVAMDFHGNTIITWDDLVDIVNPHPQDRRQIFVSEYRNGSWTLPDPHDHISPQEATGYGHDIQIRAAMDDNGNSIIIWRRDGHLYMSDYRNGTWSHPNTTADHISLDNHFLSTSQSRVVMNNNGHAVIAWEHYLQRFGKLRIFVSEYRDGTWNHPLQDVDHLKVPDCDWKCNQQNPFIIDNGKNTALLYHTGIFPNINATQFSYFQNDEWRHPISAAQDSSNQTISGAGYAVTAAMKKNGDMFIWSRKGLYSCANTSNGKNTMFPWPAFMQIIINNAE